MATVPPAPSALKVLRVRRQVPARPQQRFYLAEVLVGPDSPLVGRTVRLSAIVLVLYAGLLYLTYHTMTTAPAGFIPTQDQGYLLVNIQLPDSASLQRTTDTMMHLNKIVLGDPNDKETYPGIPGCDHTVMAAGYSALLGVSASN